MNVIGIKRKYQDTHISEDLRASSIIPVMSYNPDDHLFLCDDESVGFAFETIPLSGTSQKIFDRLNGLLKQEYPKETLLSFTLFRSPDVSLKLMQMEGIREGFHHPLMKEIIKQRKEFIDGGTVNTIDDRIGTLFFDLKLYISCKIPIKDSIPTEEELEEIKTAYHKVSAGLEGIFGQHAVMKLDAKHYIKSISSMVNWSPDASWRHQPVPAWDEDKPICEQVFDFDTDLSVTKEGISLGDNMHAQVLSAKKLPKVAYFGDAMKYAGDLSGGNSHIANNYMVTVNILYPDPEKTRANVERKRQFTINQAYGPMLKFVPILAEKKHDFDTLYNAMADGEKPVKMSYSVVIFARDRDKLSSSLMQARNIWRENQFEMMEDSYISLPMFINCLPLCADRGAIVNLFRYKTVSTGQSSVVLPLFGEWKGTGTPHMNLMSRNGQLMSFSLHDTGSNMNGVVAAQSGSGKSFAVNEMISSYMSEGAQVWVIDVGRSYKKICEAFEGDFMHFGHESGACLNPFELVTSLDGGPGTTVPGLEGQGDDEGDEDTLVGLLMAMAAPTNPLNDLQIQALKRVLNKVWKQKFRETTVDDIAAALIEEEIEEVKDVGRQLYSFTSEGAYGKYFNGDNNMSFGNQLTVLELEELKGRKHLQTVVLLQLISQIQNEMYLGDRNRKKIVIIDEAWDLLAEGGVAKFIESGYRRFRKYGGSAVIITQSIQDLYDSPTGRAIAENSATIMLLGQKAETIESVKREGKLVLPEGTYDMLKGVHTIKGVYSEIFIKGEAGMGIGRLVVNDFQKLLYSTDAREFQQIEDLTKQGLSVEQAINHILEDRKKRIA